MARLFISHSSANNGAAMALAEWLCEQGFRDVFLDIAPDRGLYPGERWQEALKAAADRCEAVLFLVSPAWLESKWCLAEFLLAKSLHKKIFGLIVEPTPLERVPAEMTQEWQLCELTGSDRYRDFEVQVFERTERVSFREAGLDSLRRGLEKAGLDGRSFPWPPSDEPNRSPYRGFKALEPQDAAVFFGRDAPIVRGLDRIRGLAEGDVERLLVILGASGSGKSSFLRAGLLPRLARDDESSLPLAPIRPESAVITGSAGLAAALAATFQRFNAQQAIGTIKETLAKGADGLHDLLAELLQARKRRLVHAEGEAGVPAIIIPLDQAEELFNPEGADEAERFLQLLSAILHPPEGRPRLRVLVVATIRSDRYELLQNDPRLEAAKPALFDLPPLPAGEFKSVIEGPAQRATESGRKLEIEPALTEALIADAKGVDALPLLAFTLERLHAEYGVTGRLSLEEYRKLGGVRGAIEQAVAIALREPAREPRIPASSPDQLAAIRAAFIPWLARIDPETGAPTRRVASVSDIPSGSRTVVERLIAARLLVSDRRDGRDVVEVAHESLLRQWPALAAWLDADAADLQLVEAIERASAEWERNERAEAWLDHRGDRLALAEQLTARPDFGRRIGERGKRYLAACRARDEAERKARQEALARDEARLAEIAAAQTRTALLQRRTRWMLTGFAVVVAAGLGLGVWQIELRQHALDQALYATRNLEDVYRGHLLASRERTDGVAVDFASARLSAEADALQPLQRYGIGVANLVPAGTKLVIEPVSAEYSYAAEAPTVSMNMLTQTDPTDAPASFTLTFDKPLDAISFRTPAMHRATASGVTAPAWRATALDRFGRELSSSSEALFRSIGPYPGDTPPQVYRLRTPNFCPIAAVRFDSDLRLNGKPFAGFAVLRIEQIVTYPSTQTNPRLCTPP